VGDKYRFTVEAQLQRAWTALVCHRTFRGSWWPKEFPASGSTRGSQYFIGKRWRSSAAEIDLVINLAAVLMK
jgi:hypothetical protein